MARRIVVEFLGSDKSASSTAAKVEQRFGKMGGRLDRVGQIAGRALAGGLAVAAVGLVKMSQAAAETRRHRSNLPVRSGTQRAQQRHRSRRPNGGSQHRASLWVSRTTNSAPRWRAWPWQPVTFPKPRIWHPYQWTSPQVRESPSKPSRPRWRRHRTAT